MILTMESLWLLILTVILLAIALLGGTVASIVLVEHAKRRPELNLALLSSLVGRAARRFGILNAVLMIAAILVMAVALGLYARFGFGPLAGVSIDSIEPHMDFNVFLHSAQALWDGSAIYSENGGPSISTNPPFWTVLMAPFALLEPIVAYRIFVLITVLVSIGYIAWMASELKLRPTWAVVGAVMLLFSNPWLGTLALGQVYPLLTLGFVTAWVADRRDKRALSGIALGLVLAVKPQYAPVLLWPLVRRRWRTVAAALGTGAAATLVGVVIAGPNALIDWLAYVSSRRPDGYWDNNTLPGAAARLFEDNQFVDPITTLPWAESAAYVLAIGIIILTTLWVRRDPEMGLWALVAASLLASSVSWHNCLVMLGPGILLLLARGWTAPALLLLALQAIPPDWSTPWRYGNTTTAALVLTLYFYILIAHWLAFLTFKGGPARSSKPELPKAARSRLS